MGRKKNNKNEKKQPAKKVMSKFDCNDCGNKSSISIEIRKDKGVRKAKIFCRVCKISTDEPIIAKVLDEPIDVYVNWLQDKKDNKLGNRQQQENNDSQGENLDDDEDLQQESE